MFRLLEIGAAGVLLAQAAPVSDSSTAITTLIGSGITGGTLLAYAWWRQRHGDELLRQRDATIEAMTKTMIEEVVPVLRDVLHASQEQRRALEQVIEAQRRGEYDSDRRTRDR